MSCAPSSCSSCLSWRLAVGCEMASDCAALVSEPVSAIAQRYARQLSGERRVDAALYSAAEHAFGQRGLVEITYLTGIYHTVCGLLNAFEIPAPGSQV
jgi:hypothetical protein